MMCYRDWLTTFGFLLIVYLLPHLAEQAASLEVQLALIWCYLVVVVAGAPWDQMFLLLDRFVPTFHRFEERLDCYLQELAQEEYEYDDAEETEPRNAEDPDAEASVGSCARTDSTTNQGAECRHGQQRSVQAIRLANLDEATVGVPLHKP